MAWQPRPLAVLEGDIGLSEYEMDDVTQRWWNMIKVPPTKWRCSPMGDLGGGFWVVGILGERCLYYNDIEAGYNWSSFHEVGTIDEYHSNQSSLNSAIASLPL